MIRSGKLKLRQEPPGKEGFVLVGGEDRTIVVAGADDSGTLYGCLELADRVRAAGALPTELNVTEAPVFTFRGPCIGMQRTELVYDNTAYDFPYTEEVFPFFYDKEHWRRYLDFLVENRMNTLYLWNGHPFTSLLELPKYPEAREVSQEQLTKNIEMFGWLTREADRRGIWVVQNFYNVHISHPLARAHKVPFHQSRPAEISKQYMRYCVSEFVRHYPNVGVMLCLGEPLSNRYDKDWMCQVIIPGVKDGMKQLGLTEEPPIILRHHSTPFKEVLPAARKLYDNIYTMRKWTSEGLLSNNPRGEDPRIQKLLAKLGKGNMINVQQLANLEPFRWGSPSFVQTCMQNARKMGAIGLHLYPLRTWEWPITADKVEPPLLQIDRDWIWFAAWARYAWNPDRDHRAEREHWVGRLVDKYGTRRAAEKILDAYQAAGPCQGMLLGRFGITAGGRQCFALGMLMTQLVNPQRYGLSPRLSAWYAPEGERLEEWAEREWNAQEHHGETPPQVAEMAERHAARAVAAVEAARPHVRKNREEFDRLANDMHCIEVLSRCYGAKARAAMHVLLYKHSRDVAQLDRAVPFLDEGLRHYRRLVELTNPTYRAACALHWPGRKIPFQPSMQRPYKHWRDCLPAYEQEVANFKRNLASLKAATVPATAGAEHKPLPPAPVKLLSPNCETFEVKPGAKLFTDRGHVIKDVAAELRGLQGIRISYGAGKRDGVRVEFELPEPATILVGFLRGENPRYAKPPEWEWEVVLSRAVLVDDFPRIDVSAHPFPAGRSDVDFGRGNYVILGFIKASQSLEQRVVFGPMMSVDKLFETNAGVPQ